MPLYEYECTACHRRTEKIQKFSDAELTVCPHCGGPLERTLTAPNVQFKGGGWYKDLYSSAKPAAGGGSGEPSGSGSGAADASSKPSGDSGGSGETAKPAATGAAASTSTASAASAPPTKA